MHSVQLLTGGGAVNPLVTIELDWNVEILLD